MVALALRPEHGYVIAAVVGSWVVHHGYCAVKVMSARKAYNVKYPALYATEENCKNEEHRTKFNCVQRGHQNALENQPSFLSLLLAAGIQYPVTAAVAGGLYLLGRILYMEGYSSGSPDARMRGALPQYVGLFTLLGAAIRFAYVLITQRV